MRPTLEQLHDKNLFKEIASFHIDETLKFLMNSDGYGKTVEEKKPSSLFQKFGVVLITIIGGLIGYFSVTWIKDLQGLQLGLGFLILFLGILPFHEWIHGLTFKSFKAPEVGYGISWKAGMVYAYAQKFPISMPELKKVAIMPFAVITPLLCIAWYLMPQYSTIFIFILLIHTMACIGDFALVYYAIKNKNKTIYTYDDLKVEKKTYFFEKL